jgi:hypothetical protein
MYVTSGDVLKSDFDCIEAYWTKPGWNAKADKNLQFEIVALPTGLALASIQIIYDGNHHQRAFVGKLKDVYAIWLLFSGCSCSVVCCQNLCDGGYLAGACFWGAACRCIILKTPSKQKPSTPNSESFQVIRAVRVLGSTKLISYFGNMRVILSSILAAIGIPQLTSPLHRVTHFRPPCNSRMWCRSSVGGTKQASHKPHLRHDDMRN